MLMRPKTFLATALLLGAGALVLFAGAHSYPYQQCNANYPADYSPQQANNLDDGIFVGWRLPMFLECEDTFLNANSGILLFIVTGLLAAIAFQQYRTTRAQLRAWISIKLDRLYNFNTSKEMLFTANITNHGATPARDLEVQAAVGVHPYLLPDDFDFPTVADLKMSKTTVYPGDPANSSFTATQFSEVDTADAVTNAKRRLYVFGIVRYFDIFGDKHWTRFAVSLVQDENFIRLAEGSGGEVALTWEHTNKYNDDGDGEPP